MQCYNIVTHQNIVTMVINAVTYWPICKSTCNGIGQYFCGMTPFKDRIIF